MPFPTRPRPARPTTAAIRKRLLAQALEVADWGGFERRRAAAKARGRLRGIGCATFIEPSGGLGQEEIAIRFDAAGGVQLYTLSRASGQGHETVYPELVADILGMPSEDIALRYSDPEGRRWPVPAPSARARSSAMAARLAVGAQEVVRKGLALAAKELEVAAGDLVFEHGRYRVPGTDLSVGLARARAQACRQRAASPRHRCQDQHGGGVPERRPCRRGRDRSRHRRHGGHQLCRGRRLRQGLQPYPGRGSAARRADAGHRPGRGRALRLRSRHRSAPDRHLHGLLHAACRLPAGDRGA